MPFNYDYSNNSSYGLFDSFRDNQFDIGIDEEELEKSRQEIEAINKEREAKNQKKADRRERLIEALPHIVAALTAKDGGQVSQVLLNYASLVQEQKARERAFEEERRKEESARAFRTEEREDIQSFEQEQSQEERLFTREENIEERQFRRGERVSQNLFDLERDDRNFDQELQKMGYNAELTKEIEEIQHGYRMQQQAAGFEYNSELYRRQTAIELSTRMESVGISPDVARSAAEQITSGIPAYELDLKERTALDLYTQWNKSGSQTERDRALLGVALDIMNTEVPIEGATPQTNPYTGKTEIPTRKLHPNEVLPFITGDPVSAIQGLITPSNDPLAPSSTGDSVSGVRQRSIYDTSVDLANSNEPEAVALKQVSQRINSDGMAADFATTLYQEYGLVAARGMLDTLPIDPKYRPIMERALEEAELEAEKVKELARRNLRTPQGVNF